MGIKGLTFQTTKGNFEFKRLTIKQNIEILYYFVKNLDLYFHQLKFWHSDMKFTGHHHCMY